MSKIIGNFEVSNDETILITAIQPMETAIIPEGITLIGHSAFENMIPLKKVVLPITLEYIYGGAFYCCNNLREINLNNKNCPDLKSIASKVFYGCTNLPPTIKIPENTKVALDAFAKCPYLGGGDDFTNRLASHDFYIKDFFILYAFSDIANGDLIEKLINKNATFSDLIRFGINKGYSLNLFFLTIWIQARLLKPDYLKTVDFDAILDTFGLTEAAKKLITTICNNKKLLTDLTETVNSYIENH